MSANFFYHLLENAKLSSWYTSDTSSLEGLYRVNHFDCKLTQSVNNHDE